MGGWAPYVSTSGMFMSSTKMIPTVPMGGPNMPFLLLPRLPSIISWVMWALVLAEKPSWIGLYFDWSSSDVTHFTTETDLPVPVGPQTNGRRPCVNKVWHMYDSCAVYPVGTMIVENSASS